MRLASILGWGIVIYSIFSLAWSGLIIYGFTSGIAPRIILFIVMATTCLIAGRALKFKTWKDILPYSISWAIVVAILDALFALPVSGFGIYAHWSVWAGYSLVVVLPLFAPLTRVIKEPHGVWES